MSEPTKKSPRKPSLNKLHDLVQSNCESNRKNHRLQVQKQVRKPDNAPAAQPLLECIQPGPLLISKPYEKSALQRRQKNKPFNPDQLERSNNDQVNKSEISPGRRESGRSTIDIVEPVDEHLSALKAGFNKILSDRCLTDSSLQQREIVFTKLRQLITKKIADAQVNLYGSIYFECCLEKPCVMDIDVQFKQIHQYDALKELLDIIQQSDLCKEARIDTEHKPSCIHLITNEPNVRVKLTSGYVRGIHLSKLIRIYTKFDPRVIKLLRLFRILAKTCDTDKPDIGMLHPVVFHIMTIHFLQQLDAPVLPCLHEYVYGIDHVPISLNDNQYPEFFRLCTKYAKEWKSANTTSVEMLFLQLLSYYVKTFNTKQFAVSIQTRMPVMKIDKNWHSKKLLVEDPTDIRRSLCQTMQSMRSIDYFRDTLHAALNYFGRKQKKPKKSAVNKNTSENNDEDSIEIVEDAAPVKEPSKSLHNSYRLFYKYLPTPVARDPIIRQNRVREYYKQSFSCKQKEIPKPIVQLDSAKEKFNDLNGNDLVEVLQHDIEQNFETMDENDDEQNRNPFDTLQNGESHDEEDENELEENFHEMAIESKDKETQEASSVANEQQPTIENQPSAAIIDESKQQDEATSLQVSESSVAPERNSTAPIDIKPTETTTDTTNDSIVSPFTSPVKLEKLVSNEPLGTTADNSSEYFYDFQAENFHAEQGAPYVCTTCNAVGHLKTECPELVLPNITALPEIDEKWINILSLLSKQITDRSKPTKKSIENRREILQQLESQFKKDYPDCSLHAFGSFYNGFGFVHSDLDVCLVFKDERENNQEEVLRIMQKILRAMRLSNAYENIQPVLHAKVPIIRSRHRQLRIEIDISLHNMLAIENTRLLKTYADIDPRVSELGYMIKHLAKFCDIGDASRGTLSSYAYIIMLIHFLQQTRPAVLPVLQKLSDDPNKPNGIYKKCAEWNVYFYEDLTKIKNLWKNENTLTTGALWIEFLRYYTEQFNYEEHVVTIRQLEPLFKHEKGWFRQTIAIEDPFELSHNLAGGLSPRNWILIRRVFIRARQQFGVQPKEMDLSKPNMTLIEETLFNIDELCPTNAPKRCEWCKGPYHIRKRCPTLASLAHEKERKKRLDNHSEQQKTPFIGNNFNSSPNTNYRQLSNYTNGHQRNNQPKSAPTNQRPFRYPHPPELPNEYPRMNNTPRWQQPQNYKTAMTCFKCGEIGHMRKECPQQSTAKSVHSQKSS
ncbi:unnamed protein product [Adineta ricciae]|uniref:CCHC-type domain-containing protein n=1 Tax=Adineta ricciae TaxID=249248 RepID=A0A814IA78_ADIRI|nr:unnamed protein product [Adineta ricciae]CAF1033821.1 unnamed protein product [Adineta ricciae]